MPKRKPMNRQLQVVLISVPCPLSQQVPPKLVENCGFLLMWTEIWGTTGGRGSAELRTFSTYEFVLLFLRLMKSTARFQSGFSRQWISNIMLRNKGKSLGTGWLCLFQWAGWMFATQKSEGSPECLRLFCIDEEILLCSMDGSLETIRPWEKAENPPPLTGNGTTLGALQLRHGCSISRPFGLRWNILSN